MFEIGKKVICIKTHSQGVVQEGKIYPILDLKECTKCKLLMVDVGSKASKVMAKCICGNNHLSDGVHWVGSHILKPLDESFAEEVLENILEQIQEEELIEV